MAPLYEWSGAAGFSKTARSGPGHGEAGRGGLDLSLLAVQRRGLAGDLGEGAAEGAEAVEADLQADVGDAAIGFAQQEHGPLDASALQVAVRRLAESRAEGANEVRFGHARDVGQ